MVAKLDWDKAAADERVRSRGGEPFWLGLPMPQSLRDLRAKPANTKPRSPRPATARQTRSPAKASPAVREAAKRLRKRGAAVVKEFCTLNDSARASALTLFQTRISALSADERRAFTSPGTNIDPVDGAERELRALLGTLSLPRGQRKRGKHAPSPEAKTMSCADDQPPTSVP